MGEKKTSRDPTKGSATILPPPLNAESRVAGMLKMDAAEFPTGQSTGQEVFAHEFN